MLAEEASMHRRVLACALLAWSAIAWAQGYPDRPLRLVVGFPPGGSGDFLARIVADDLTREFGQPIVVDNKPGAGSNIAAEQVARATPDGYTILLAGNFTHAINPWLYRNLSWDPHRDFTPITEVATMSIIVCVTPDRKIRSMKELIARVKSEPGRWFYATPGNGTSQHLAGAEINRLTGTDMQHVPFKGGAPSLAAVLAGDVQVIIGTTPVVLPQIRAGKLVPLALITRSASPMVPGVPGMEEAGVPGIDLGSWWGIWAPPGIRPEVKAKLFTSITRVMRRSGVAEKLAREAMEPAVSASPEEFAAFVRRDHASYEAIVRASGARAD
jgi:tripartite-type tricarboxylate transporter receptor subunit TctC